MSLEVNKVFAAVLTAGVVFMVAGVVGGAIVHPHRLETSAIAVATPEPAAAPAAPVEAQPIGPLLAAANPDTGRQIAQRACASCHNFTQGGPNGVGPNLWGVVNGPHAHVEGFNYSAAMRAKHDQPWDYEALNAFLTRPSAAIPGTRMAYAGMSSINQRADLIAFLRSLAAEPAPLP
ncbi:cytochrome c family protein [Roseomonas frigidaquae]|uniref:Cytochrome c family protein n=1 Tax=Falsiroseomonas frigidaquae TaxID=487318 RepID=A0ABX1EYM6_9PROT|nr:cytochrome c family protein [Falsiroseomonas frigidaquae]NKE45210.1 cytochrome c family protein [Falsiroseomonas frigidaquae]